MAGVAKHDGEKEIEERRKVRKRSGQIGLSVFKVAPEAWCRLSGPRANISQHIRRNSRVARKMVAFAFANPVTLAGKGFAGLAASA
jgi:hypothetical protein